MTTYFVDSAGSNTSPYDTWAKAATALNTVLNGTTGTAGDIVYVANTHSETVGGAYTAQSASGSTIANPCRVLCVTPSGTTGNSGLATGALVQATSTAYTIAFDRNFYMYGITFDTGSSGTGAADMTFATAASRYQVFENCTFKISANSSSDFAMGSPSSQVIFKDCAFHFRHASGRFKPTAGWAQFFNCNMSAGSTHPAILINGPIGNIRFEGCDLSNITGTLVDLASNYAEAYFVGCKLGSGVALATAPTGVYTGNVYMFDCHSGDVHYAIAHSNIAGSMEVEGTIVMNTDDAAKYDGTNPHSWKITTTAYCSYLLPYVCPAIDVYNAGSSTGITPYVEILRNNDSTTAYTDDEVWAMWSYKGTSGYTNYSLSDDRRALLASAAAQDDGAGLTAWNGASGNCKSSKLIAPSMTTAEAGYIRCRVVVGKPSIAGKLFINPKILGLS